MKPVSMISAALALVIASVCVQEAVAGHGTLKSRVAARQSQASPWHGAYYDVAWGGPVALVVPPTAESQWHLGWGVGADRVTPIYHQFQPGYPEPMFGRAGFLPTPRWPSSTDQFGDYYIRGPW